MDADPATLIVPVAEAHAVYARQHRATEKDLALTRRTLVGAGAVSKAKPGLLGSAAYNVSDLSILSIARSVTDTSRNTPAAVRAHPYLKTDVGRVEDPGSDAGKGPPSELALNLHYGSFTLREAIAELFIAGARDELGPHIALQLDIDRRMPGAELYFNDKQSGWAFRRSFMPPADGDLMYIATMPDYQDPEIGTSLSYSLHRAYFVAIGKLIRDHGKVGDRHEAGRPRRVTTEFAGNREHKGKNTLQTAREQGGNDLLSDRRLDQREQPPWQRPTASPTPPEP